MKQEVLVRKMQEIRAYLSLSQADFGRMTGHSAMFVSRTEKGISFISEEYVRQVCDSFKLSPKYFEDTSGMTEASGEGEKSGDAAESDAADVCSVEKYITGGKEFLKEIGESRIRCTALVDSSEVGRRLKEIRTEKGLAIKELALLSGIDGGQISKIENHGKTVTERTAKKLSLALEVGVEWLLFGDENRKDYPVDDAMIAWLWENEEMRRKGEQLGANAQLSKPEIGNLVRVIDKLIEESK